MVPMIKMIVILTLSLMAIANLDKAIKEPKVEKKPVIENNIKWITPLEYIQKPDTTIKVGE